MLLFGTVGIKSILRHSLSVMAVVLQYCNVSWWGLYIHKKLIAVGRVGKITATADVFILMKLNT